ncbi:MAG: aminopeptidase P family protein [bacterium]|nr:aminopeptidase P family protein [bacterium]MCM1423673.1 aminopeptidase P family protein [bacterium]
MEKTTTVKERLQALRKEMEKRHFAAYIVPTEDFHGSEYVGAHFKAREYLSGFTGSAGTLLVLRDSAALWTDGRYFLQAREELKDSGIKLMESGEPGVLKLSEYLAETLAKGARVGFDGRTVTGAFVKELQKKTAEKELTFHGKEDLTDLVWQGRPPLSAEPVWELPAAYAGLSREEKLSKVREKMEEKGADAFLVTDLTESAWLLNLRGNDVKNTPVFLAYMLLTKRRTLLCAQADAFSEAVRKELAKTGVTLLPYESIAELVGSLPAGQRLWADENRVNYRLLGAVSKGVAILNEPSPIAILKAVKTERETEHMRSVHVKDGVALTRFICWLKSRVKEEEITEISAAAKLEAFRTETEGYLGPSFDPIIAYGPHGAIVHYDASPETDVRIEPKGLCLVDTGGHYSEGTTDVTRTIVLGELTAEEKRAYTLVLKGHLRLMGARFPEGVSGQNLDAIARGPLWEQGLDYRHGTGHGVGYLLSVHEGPQNIRWRQGKEKAVPLAPGMIFSNEPGYYAEGAFGVRHENLMLVVKGQKTDYGQFLELMPLTMAPFDRDGIEAEMLNAEERALLNAYHQKVYETLSPFFSGEELAWLREATAAF